MIWPNDVSFEGYSQKKDEWFNDPNHFLGDPPISAQYALDLIFKTLVDDKEHYPYLTTMPESNEQTNSIMLELILQKHSKKYRKHLRKENKNGKM
jgi:hypothetical protein